MADPVRPADPVVPPVAGGASPPPEAPPAAPGVGGDGGGINPLPAKDFMELCSEAWQALKDFLVAFQDALFMHFPTGGDEEQAVDEQLQNFFNKWFPKEVTFVENDSHETMIAELEKLGSEDFKIILRAFNQVVGLALDEDTTTPALLINDHLKDRGVVTLGKEHFEGHEKLLRPYGLTDNKLDTAIGFFPDNIKSELKVFVPEGTTMRGFYSENMHVLKRVIFRHLDG